MNLKDLKIEGVEVKNKILLINEADLTEAEMADLSVRLKKAGAIEVVYAYGGVSLQTLADDDLKDIGLMRIPELSLKTH